MPLVCAVSPKGGVGKTTLTAGLASALHLLGRQTVAVDLDPQNALALHFGIVSGRGDGLIGHIESSASWADSLVRTRLGFDLLSYGSASSAEIHRIEERLAANPGWLIQQVSALAAPRETVVLVDLPPGPSPYLRELVPHADLALIVLLADAASAAMVDRVESGEFLGEDARDVRYVLNQVAFGRRLSLDVTEFLKRRMGSALLGLIHHDEAIAEALAAGQVIMEYAPDSAAARDIVAAARRIDALLPIPIGDHSSERERLLS